jgi:hypothetical protein
MLAQRFGINDGVCLLFHGVMKINELIWGSVGRQTCQNRHVFLVSGWLLGEEFFEVVETVLDEVAVEHCFGKPGCRVTLLEITNFRKTQPPLGFSQIVGVFLTCCGA